MIVDRRPERSSVFRGDRVGQPHQGAQGPKRRGSAAVTASAAGCGDGSHRGLAGARRGDPTNCCTVAVASRASLHAITAASQGHEAHSS